MEAQATAKANVPDHPAFRSKHPGYLTFEKILGALAVLTFFETVVSVTFVKESLYSNQTAVIMIALLLLFTSLVKATLVGGYFMHVFYEKRPFTIFMIAFGFPALIVLPIAIMVVTV